jgi:hypothetical protein
MRGLWGYSRVKILLGLPLVLLLVTCCFGADSLVVYQVGAKEQQSWTVFKDFFREKGYDVFFHQDETTLEKHLERIGKINRGPAKFFLAMELVFGEDGSVLVAMTDQKGSEGSQGGSLNPLSESGNRFLTIDELPAKYASESGRLAEAVAASFNVKVKHLSLFPLVGVDMPGIFLRIGCKQDKAREMLGLLHRSIQTYLRRDVSHER